MKETNHTDRFRPYRISRRRFLELAGGVTLLAGCNPVQQSIATPEPTSGPLSEPQLLRKSYQSTATQKQREYFLYLPRGYETDKEKIWPVILFLHGSGERGDGLGDLDYVLDHGPLMEAWIQRRDLPFIIISPQLPVFSMSDQIVRPKTKPQRLESGVPPRDEERPTKPMIRAEGDPSPLGELGPPDGWWKVEEDLLNMVDSTLSDYRADSKRVYLTGLSYGGFGTWYMATYHSDRWAAIAPICGLGDPTLAQQLAAVNMPIWIFQGGRDDVIQPQWIYPMANSLEEAGLKTVRLTIHEDLGHNAWTRVYAGEDLYNWFLSHTRE
jgi:predicted peptidase